MLRGNPTSAEDLLIHRQICHLAMVEHVASPGNDAFMPGTECTEVYLLDQGFWVPHSVQMFSAGPCNCFGSTRLTTASNPNFVWDLNGQDD